MKKKCIFCGCRASTNEDVMPKWILRLLRKQECERVPMRTYRLGQPPKDRLVKESAQKVRNVCGMCNNGWMSQLETEARQILLSPQLQVAARLGQVLIGVESRLVQFEDMPYADRADAYLGFLTAAESLLQHHVDLVEVGAVRNPYLRRGIEQSRELVYAT